jgi:hypothetical protein
VTDLQKKVESLGAKIDPDLRGFIDSVIVPMLVNEYIGRHGSGIHIAGPTRAVPQFQLDTRPSAERIPR